MTVNTTTSRVSYAGNGSTTAFAVNFYFLASADLVVIKTTSAGAQTTLVLNTDYTVSGAGNPAGGTVTCTVAPASTESLVIFRSPAETQLTDYQANDPFPAETHERALDKLTMIAQRLKDLTSRSLTLSDGDTTTASTDLPSPVANKLIGWNATATGLQNIDQSTLATIVAFGTASADKFSGNGTTTNFTLSSNPAALNNLDVSISGVTQRPGIDYTWTSGTTITFTSAPPSGTDNILVRYLQALPQGASDSASATFIQAGTGAVTRTAQAKMRETVSAFDYMTTAEIAAVQSYAYAVDVTATLQNAINQAFALQADLFIPAGGYSVTGLYLPGRVSGGIDDRGKAIRIYGQGTGEPFVVSAPKGTVIKSVTNAPVLQDYLDTDPSSNGTVEIDHIRFDGTSSTPVVLLQSFYGTSSFYNNVIYQRGTGDGLKIGYSATVWVHECYSLNKDFVTFTLGAARTGVGFNYVPTYDGGLVTISKCTSRGWLTAYRIGGGAGKAYSPAIRDSECSVVYNGIILDDTRKAIVSGCYMEGGDQGIGVTDTGDWSTIRDTLIFPGFAKGIDSTSTTNKGTLIEGNIISLGSVVNAIGIDISSSATFGGYNKNIIGNSLVYTLGTAGVNGVKISGAEPRLNVTGNMFDPRGAWTGVGSTKINNTSTGAITGLVTGQTGDAETAYLSNAAIAIRQGSSSLTESSVTANNLTVPDGVSYFSCAATVATTVQRFTAGQTSGRLVTFRTTNANMTFQDTAYNQLAGGVSFTGPGTITFLIDRLGADSYGWEVSRTVF